MEPAAPRPTIKTLSGMTGFSIATISRARRNAPVVTEATRKAAHAATRRLRDGGHRRMALVNPAPEPACTQDRIKGCARALAESGPPLDPALFANADLAARFGRATALALREGSDPATGCLCVNEATSSGVPAEFMLRLLDGEDTERLTHFVKPERIVRQDDRLCP